MARWGDEPSGAVTELVADWLGPSGQEDPYAVFRQLHKHGPVIGVPGGLTLVVGYVETEAVLRDPRFVVEDSKYHDLVAPGWREHRSRTVLNRSMLFVNGDEHTRMRRLVDSAFTAKRVDGLREMVTRRVGSLTDRLARRTKVDFIEEFAYLLPVNIICDLLGVAERDRKGFRQPVSELARALDPGWIHADLAVADSAAAELADYFTGLIKDRDGHAHPGLLGTMVAANVSAGCPLSRDDLVANAVLMLLAGFETTVGLLGNGLKILLEHPELRAHLRSHPDTCGSFVAEVLRFDTPVQLTGRRAAVDATIGAARVPAGSSVVLAFGAANRDPARFAEADTFDIDRPAYQPLAFGFGRHHCLGARLARLEGELAFSALVERFPRMELAGQLERLDRHNLRGFATLPVVLSA